MVKLPAGFVNNELERVTLPGISQVGTGFALYCVETLEKEKPMVKYALKEKSKSKKGLDARRLITDEEYGANLNALIAYYQIVRGEAKKRLASSRNAA